MHMCVHTETHTDTHTELTYIVTCMIPPPIPCQKAEAAEKATLPPAAPEGLAGEVLTVVSLVLCFDMVPEVHVPTFPNSIAAEVYSQMLS